ncbi:MAG: hypothetical protein QXL16_02070 [Candidatus Micrarchaeaceae archaeon]
MGCGKASSSQEAKPYIVNKKLRNSIFFLSNSTAANKDAKSIIINPSGDVRGDRSANTPAAKYQGFEFLDSPMTKPATTKVAKSIIVMSSLSVDESIVTSGKKEKSNADIRPAMSLYNSLPIKKTRKDVRTKEIKSQRDEESMFIPNNK